MADVTDIASSPRMRFSAAFDELEVAYDRKVTVSRREVYWKYLKKVPIDDLVAAVSMCVDSYTTFPKIPQWRKAADRCRRMREERENKAWKTGDGVPLKELPRPDHGGYFCGKCRDTGWEAKRQWIEESQREYDVVAKCCRDGSNPRVSALMNLGARASRPYFQDEGEKEAASRREEREPGMFE
jgi:hypothetical protein